MKSAGFTLMEVLIALVILSISLTAIVKATSSDIRNTKRLEENTIAQWVINDAFNLIKMGAITLNNNETTQVTTMAERKWRWHAELQTTQNPKIKKILISVFLNKSLILSMDDTMLVPKK
jgi:general secretion pathway protein I